MNATTAKLLLNRYFTGETSLKEESLLADYLMQCDDLPPELLPYRSLFGYFTDQRRVSAPKPKPRRRLLYSLAAVAATVALLLAGWWSTPSPELTNFPVTEATPVDWSRYEVTDEREALRILAHGLGRTGKALSDATHISLREITRAGQAAPIQK